MNRTLEAWATQAVSKPVCLEQDALYLTPFGADHGKGCVSAGEAEDFRGWPLARLMRRGQGGALAATSIGLLVVVSVVCFGVYFGLVQGFTLHQGSFVSSFKNITLSSSNLTSTPSLADRLAARLRIRQQQPQQGQHAGAGSKHSSPARLFPKVALLFLTRGDMPYEAVWRSFLEGVPGPAGSNNQSLPPWESHFAVHVHPAMDYTYPKGSLFEGRETPERAQVAWGQFSVMQAELNLFAAALADPQAQRFVLLSESCIPLYPALLVYIQLMSETKSRLNACTKPDDPNDANSRNEFRWHTDMKTDFLDISHWRKSSQWVGLIRKHAEVVHNDERVREKFKSECWVDQENMDKGQPLRRFCVSDEHYIPTLIASLNLENETDCTGGVTNAWWDGPYFHPRTWEPQDVSLALVNKLRNYDNAQCKIGQALEEQHAEPANQGGDYCQTQ
ncbi:hypothetical protein WJX72_003085 [[Myrmecia] bisecta]|uniref:Uncharacterized protein n=1 Tax=[Myrmecia] bisecta TaxID=41462 RepID=A0AAW1Q3M7_9CHLO